MARMSRKLVYGATFLFISLAAAFLFAGMYVARHFGRQAECNACMHSVAYALLQYHDRWGQFPPRVVYGVDGRPAHSWRAFVLGHIDPDLAARYQWTEPWNGPNNRKLHSMMPSQYCCPSSPEFRKRGWTTYFGVSGENTCFSPNGGSLRDLSVLERSGVVLLVESDTMKVNWLQPEDVRLVGNRPAFDSVRPALSSPDHDGPAVCTADGICHRCGRWVVGLSRLVTVGR